MITVRHLYRNLFTPFVLHLLLFGSGAAAALAAQTADPCAGALPAVPDSVVRGFGELAWRFDLPAAGLLTLELGGMDNDALALAVRPCAVSPATAPERIVVEESATHQSFAVREGGSWLVEVTARGRRPPEAVKLTASFVEAEVRDEDIVRHKEENHEVDPDPLLAAGVGEIVCVGVVPGRIVTKEENHEVDPDPARLAGRCRPPEPGDDHGDTFACATPLELGRSVAAELGNGWGDDEDVYRFALAETRSVEVAVAGEALATLGLYDHFGQRLDEGDRIVRTLRPGTYFVRVAGDGRGAYELTAAAPR